MDRSQAVNSSALVVVLLVLIVTVAGQYPFWPEIRISQGHLRGRVLKSENGKEFSAFLGIPYATPPIGVLRFKASIPYPGWSHILSAETYREACPQFDSQLKELGNEDCLYANVYTPLLQRFSPDIKLPVMVYIQAESYENGDSSLYGPEKLMDKEVVLVTFNYRLGILGFLSTEDDAASGNWGLHDQRLALDWVKANIQAFGGDPNSVTLFGQGAGASAVLLHILSPLSQGLLHRGIMQSGSALCDWAMERSPLVFARDVAQGVGCPSSPPTDLVNCLRTIPPSALLKAQNKAKIFGEFPQKAAPVIEKPGVNRFLTEEPRDILRRGSFQRIPLIIGVNKDEGAYFYPLIFNRGYFPLVLTDTYKYRNDPFFHEKELIPKFLEAATRFRGRLREAVIPPILFTYFNGIDPTDVSQVAHSFINMTTDALYVSCMDETLKLYWESRAPVFMYAFEYRGENTMVNLLTNNAPTVFDTGVCHGDELFSLFKLNVDGLRIPSYEDNKVSQRLLTLWTDFAKYGYAPRLVNYEFPKWEQFHPNRLIYYRIGKDLIPQQGYKQREAHFWSRHLPNITGTYPHVLPRTDGRPMYRTLAWTMVAVSISLLILVAVLLSILYYQRRSQSFKAQDGAENGSSHISAGSTLY